MKHFKLFSVLTHRPIFVRLIGVLLKVTPHCDSLQHRFPETPGCHLPGTNSTLGEKWNRANAESTIYNHQKQSMNKSVTLSNWNKDKGLHSQVQPSHNVWQQLTLRQHSDKMCVLNHAAMLHKQKYHVYGFVLFLARTERRGRVKGCPIHYLWILLFTVSAHCFSIDP